MPLLAASGPESSHQADDLFTKTYEELRLLAHQHLIQGRPGQTLNTTALVHEVYFKMINQDQVYWRDRAHFLAIASKAMRQILVDYARMRRTIKRGGRAEQRIVYRPDMPGLMVENQVVEILDLDHALSQLALLDERLGHVVELRFFGGLSIAETAQVLGVTARTVNRDWIKAKAYLYFALTQSDPSR